MADPRFFSNVGPFTLSQLCTHIDAKLSDPSASEMMIGDVGSLDKAQKGQISFLNSSKYGRFAHKTQASAVLIAQNKVALLPKDVVGVVCADPYRAYAKIAQIFYPSSTRSLPMPGDGFDDDAYNPVGGGRVHKSAKIGTNVAIGYGVLIGANARIGDNTHIAAYALIGEGVVIGQDCTIGAHSLLGYCQLGDRIILHGHVCIGQDGFGFALIREKTKEKAQKLEHIKIPQLGRAIIQSDVEIQACSTIDRGALDDTVIGAGTKMDNQVHIAHNVVLGQKCLVSGCVGIAGGVRVGDYVVIGGASVISGHLKIGDFAFIGGFSWITRDVPSGVSVAGVPAYNLPDYLRDVSFVRRLRKKTAID